MVSLDDVWIPHLQSYDDLEEGEIIEDNNKPVFSYDVEHCRPSLHECIQNDPEFLALSNQCMGNIIDRSTAPHHDSEHQSRMGLSKQAHVPSGHIKYSDKAELKQPERKHSKKKYCKNGRIRSKKYFEWRRSPSVSSLSNCSCSSCSSSSSEESKNAHLKDERPFPRKCSSGCFEERVERDSLAQKVTKDANLASSTVRRKKPDCSKYSEKSGSFRKSKKKYDFCHSLAYQKAINSQSGKRREEILHYYHTKNRNSHYHRVPKKTHDFHYYLSPSPKHKESSSHSQSSKKSVSKDILRDVQRKASIKSKLVPGSLGEMLLKNQLKGRLKTVEQKPPLMINSNNVKSTSSLINTSLDNNGENISELASLNVEIVKSSKITEEQIVDDNDDEEDELTLRYKALQSAVKSCVPGSLFQSNLSKILDAAKKDLENAALKSCKLPDTSPVNSPQPFIVLDDDNTKDDFENFNEHQTSKDKCEVVMVDMEISNDSVNDTNFLGDDEKQSDLKTDRDCFKTDQSDIKMKSCHPNEREKPCDTVTQDSNLSFPIEWAYMIPPPPQPGQPDNNLNSVNSWCFNQNMYIQSMEEIPNTDVNQDLRWQSVEAPQLPSESYGAYTHPYQFPYQPSDVTDTTLSHNIQDGNFDANATDFCYQQQPEESNANDELRDTHAEQYRTFMSTFLHNNCQGIFNRKEKHRDLVEINLKPLVKTKSQKTPNIRSKPIKTSFSNKRKLRRRKRSMRKSLRLGDGAENATVLSSPTVVSAPNFPSYNSLSKGNSSAVEEEDEDILRAQLLNDMALKNKSLPFSVSKQNEDPEKVKIDVISRTLPLNTMAPVQKKKFVKTTSSFPSKQPRKWVKNEKRTKVNALKPPKKTDRRLDIGGRYLDPKNRFCDVPQTDKISISKFPPVKPVIISLNNSSDSENSESEKASTLDDGKKDCDRVISGIFELIKSCRNSQEGHVKPKTETSNGQTPKSVYHLSKEQQEEYRKLRALLVAKNKAIERRKAASVKAVSRYKNKNPTLSVTSSTQSKENLKDESSEPENSENVCDATTIKEQEVDKVSIFPEITSTIIMQDSSSGDCIASNAESLEDNSPCIGDNIEPPTTESVESSCPEERELPFIDISPQEVYAEHSYSLEGKVVDATTDGVPPTNALLQEINVESPGDICSEAPDEMIASNTEKEEDDDSSSSSESSSSSSGDSDSDSESESEVDQTEIALRNKLLRKRRELLLKSDEVAFPESPLSREPLPEVDQVNEKDNSSLLPFEIESQLQIHHEAIGVVSNVPPDVIPEQVSDSVSEHQCLYPNSVSAQDHQSSEHASKTSDLSGKNILQLNTDSSEDLKRINDESCSHLNPSITTIEKDSESNKQTHFNEKPVTSLTSPQKNKATAAALMKSLENAKLKTKIMRGEHRKHLKKQIEEEIKKKDLSKRMFTSRIHTLLKEASTDDNLCQSLFTQVVKLFSQIDALQKERKEKISNLTVTVAKATKLLQKFEEDIHTMAELQKLGKQVTSADDEFSPILNLDLSVDEEERKGFVVQMNTLQHNLQLNIAQEQLLSKTFSNRFDLHSANRGKTKREFVSKRAPTSTAAASTRKFKLDNRPLSLRRTEPVEGEVKLPSSLPSPSTILASDRKKKLHGHHPSLTQHLALERNKEEKKASEKVEVVLQMDNDRGKCAENVGILCPHDLLGRCNDDFCVYQHTSAAGQVRDDFYDPSVSGDRSSHSITLDSDKQSRIESPDNSPQTSTENRLSASRCSTVSSVVKHPSVTASIQSPSSENAFEDEQGGNIYALKDLSEELTCESNSSMTTKVVEQPLSKQKRKSADSIVGPKRKKKTSVSRVKGKSCFSDGLHEHSLKEKRFVTTKGDNSPITGDALSTLSTPLCDAEHCSDSNAQDTDDVPCPAQPSRSTPRRTSRRGRGKRTRPLRTSRRIQEKLKKH